MRGKSLIAMSLMLVLAISLANINVASAPAVTVKLSPADNVHDPPASFTLSVLIQNSPKISGWQFKVTWDFSVLGFPPVCQKGTFLNTYIDPVTHRPYLFNTFFLPSAQLGYLLVGSFLTEQRIVGGVEVPPEGDGTLATITFNVIDTGKTKISIFDVKLIDYYNAYTIYYPDVVEGANFHTNVPVASFSIWPKRYVFSHASSAVHASARVSEFESMTPMTEALCPYDGEPMTVADIIQVYTPGIAGKTMTFDASSSWSPVPGVTINKYEWDFGDGTPIQEGPVVPHAFAEYRKDPYIVKLTVTDSAGYSWSKTIEHRVWRDLAVVDIWPSIQWFDTTDYRFFHGTINKGELIYGPTYKPSGMYYIEVLATVTNFGTVTEKVGVTMTAKCIETGTEYTLMWFDWLPSPTGRYAFIRPGKDSGWLYDFYWHTDFPSILDAGTYIFTAKVTSKTYDPAVAPANDFAGVNYAVPGHDDDLSNNVKTLTEIVDAQADLSEHRESPRAFSFTQHGQMTFAGKAVNKEKIGYNVVGTYAKVVFKVIDPTGKPITIETGWAYLENEQTSVELITTWVPKKVGVYTGEAFVMFGWSPENFRYTSLTVKPFSFSVRP